MASLISKASLLMVPSVYEDGTLYNVLPSGNKAPDETGNHNGYDQTRADFTFSRGSNLAATRVNSDGLIEKGRENLLLQSNQFDTTWSNVLSGSITSGQSGYDGTNNAWKLSKGATAYRYIIQSLSVSGVYTYSLYAKADTLNQVTIFNDTGGSNPYAKFSLVDGSVVASSGLIDSSATDAGNGWWRLSATFNTTITTARIYPDFAETTAGSIYIQDAQLEYGLVSTPVIRTGSTTATAGVLENTPRIDYSSGAGALLLEPSRKNRLQYSNYFGNWTISGNISITPNQVVSPEGLQNASVIDFSSATATHGVYVFGGTPSASVSRTIYLKGAVGGETLDFSDPNQGGGSNITLTTEWQRFEFTGGSTALCGIWLKNSVGNIIHAYGAQIEEGSYPTSLIPNHGESGGVTRAADSCSVTGVSDVIGQTEGTIYVDIQTPDAIQSNTTFSIGGGTSSEYAQLEIRTDLSINWRYRAGGVDYINANVGSYSAGDRLKLAFGYKNGDSILYLNGSSIATDTGSIVSNSWDEVKYSNFAGTGKLEASVKETILFNERLTNSELATLTTL